MRNIISLFIPSKFLQLPSQDFSCEISLGSSALSLSFHLLQHSENPRHTHTNYNDFGHGHGHGHGEVLCRGVYLKKESGMADSAINPATGERKSTHWFISHGLKEGRCSVCDQRMGIVADHTPGMTEHFRHKPHSPCPTVTQNRIRYENLETSEYDDEQAVVLRNSVSEGMYEISLTFQNLAGASIQEFKDALKKADDINIWRYKGLTINFVPYILLTFVDMFECKGNKFRDEDFFFVLPAGIRTLDGLWNRTTAEKNSVIKIARNFEIIT